MSQILVESSYGSIWRDIMEGITWFAGERRLAWQINCVTTGELPAALKLKPDGAMCLLRHAQKGLIQKLVASRVPAVNMLRDIHGQIPSVMSDNELIGRRAAEHLHGQGFRHFCFVGVDREYSAQRERGFRERLERLGHSAGRCPIPLGVEQMRAVKRAAVERRLQKWLVSLPRPVALFACADFVARTLLDCCRQMKVAVPEEAAILGVDNDLAICDLTAPPLSSIPQNMRRIGFEAARLLEGIMRRQRRPRAVLQIPPREIVVRRSTDFIAIDDPRLAGALRHLRTADPATLTMRDLVRHAGVSRQWLDRQFRLRLGTTPSVLIRQQKLAAARALLLETHLPIQTVARRAGFTRGENLSRFFQEHLRMSPREFRVREGFLE